VRNHDCVRVLCRVAAIAAAMALATRCWAEERTEKYPDGKTRRVYNVDKGKLHGPFKEFYKDGALRVEGAYREGKLQGPLRSFHSNGKPLLNESYLDGLRNGKCVVHDEGGLIARVSNYRAGKLHGERQVFANNRLESDELWLDGQMLIPKSQQIIARELQAIQKAPIQTVGEFPAVAPRLRPALQDRALQAQREAALRLLMGYRFLCDVPYKDLVLDRTYIAHCEAASEIMTRLGKLTHSPENPGMPEAEYEFARKGCGCSNIFSDSSLTGAVKAFMNDSDPGNIDRLGHRRWCLNPAMLKTGFGGHAKMSAMWSFDGSRKNVPDFDFVAFPPRGLTPVSSFPDGYAWSVSLNPAKYQPPSESTVKVMVYPARFVPRPGAVEKASQPLALNYFKVSLDGFGVPNCIIYRPTGARPAPGASYWVRIEGLKNSKGEDARVEFLVAFVAM
jgi:hypothetical protein